MMEPTIVQNGALYEMQHPYTKTNRKRLRLRQTGQSVVGELRQNFAIIGARAAEWLEPWNSYRPTTA